MRGFFVMICALVLLSSCKNEIKKVKPKAFSDVAIETIFQDSTLSIRAIELLADNSLAFAANNGTFGLYNVKDATWMTSQQAHDSLNLQFRAVAHTNTDFFMLSVENPALLYKTGDAGQMELVYKEANDKVFYDAMQFWNDQEGIAIGDPTDDCLSIITTRDGGYTWNKMPCDNLPKIKEGEAAFAASNTNIAIVGNHTWIATGGNASRVLYSSDKGKTWSVFETPIIQGLPTTGMYSIAFYDEENGFAIGGDYTKPNDNQSNKIKTIDGGKTWQLVAQGQQPGYSSCVQFVPNSDAKKLITVGSGIDYSIDGGLRWKRLSDEAFHTIRFLNDSVAYAAGNGRISKLKFQ
jgi:photosystem II stability/assembly factor-like uncharacterized protein